MLPPQVILRKCGLSLVLPEPPQGRLQGKVEEVSRCTQLLFAVVIYAPSFVHLLSNHWAGDIQVPRRPEKLTAIVHRAPGYGDLDSKVWSSAQHPQSLLN